MKNRVYIKSLISGVIIAFLLTFIQLPFYVTKPGLAQDLAPIVEVEGGYEEAGSLMLTTVRMGKASIFSYLLAKVSDYQKIYPVDAFRKEDESEEEYMYRQLHMMEGSQESAISVAYTRAQKQINYEYNGIYVMSIVANMPSEKELKIGDRIFQVDGSELKTAEEFIDYVSSKKSGDLIQLILERKGEVIDASIPLQPFPDNPEKIGVGISLVTDREMNVTPKVKIDTEKIGGPSAGLMFSLEIYNQLIEEDLTKGYEIAGTGTINFAGEVGPIGGIAQKIVAANKAGVQIFFAPNENGSSESNYKEALKTVEDINSDMKIVPVDTFDDAVTYLLSDKLKVR